MSVKSHMDGLQVRYGTVRYGTLHGRLSPLEAGSLVSHEVASVVAAKEVQGFPIIGISGGFMSPALVSGVCTGDC